MFAVNRSRTLTPELAFPWKWSVLVFQLLACNIACLVIASLYYTWRDVHIHRRQREKLNDRVAYMLWVAAHRAA